MDNKFKKELIGVLDQQFDEKFIRLFNQGFEEVVLPNIDRLENGQEDLKARMDRIEMRLDSQERKADRLLDKSGKSSNNLVDVRKELKSLRKIIETQNGRNNKTMTDLKECLHNLEERSAPI